MRRVRLLPGLAVVVLTVLLLWLAGRVAEVLLFLFISVLIAVYLEALTTFLVERLHVGHRAAFALGLLVTLAALAAIGALVFPPLAEQTRQLVAKLPDYAVAWKDRFGRLLDDVPALQSVFTPEKQAQMVSGAVDQVQSFVGGLLPRVFDVAHWFIVLVSTIAMGMYLAVRPDIYRDFLISVTPPRHREAAATVLAALGRTLRAWVLAQLLTMAILGALTAIGLRLLSVPYWLTFGIFSGLAAIVPFFGTLISTLVPALFVLGGAGGLVGALLVLLLGLVVHLIEGNVVEPLIMARGVHVPPVFSILAVLIAVTLLGVPGLLVAVPAVCVVMVLIRKILIERVYGDASTREAKRQDAELALAPAEAPPGSPAGG